MATPANGANAIPSRSFSPGSGVGRPRLAATALTSRPSRSCTTESACWDPDPAGAEPLQRLRNQLWAVVHLQHLQRPAGGSEHLLELVHTRHRAGELATAVHRERLDPLYGDDWTQKCSPTSPFTSEAASWRCSNVGSYTAKILRTPRHSPIGHCG